MKGIATAMAITATSKNDGGQELQQVRCDLLGDQLLAFVTMVLFFVVVVIVIVVANQANQQVN